jgi:rubrerythrin
MALFAVAELLDMAVKDEETGIAFYRALAEATTSEHVKEQCLAISRQEEGHAKRFRKMVEEVGQYQSAEEYPGQYEDYVRSLLESRAFPDPGKAAQKAREAASDADALDTAMRLERDTLLFLQEMKNFVPQTHTEYVDEIIGEERGHLTDLTRLKASLS